MDSKASWSFTMDKIYFEDLISNCLNVNMLQECIKSLSCTKEINKVRELLKKQIRLLTKGPTNEEKKQAETHRLKANDCLRKKDQLGAYREFSNSIKIDPTNPVTFSERSLIYFVNKNYKEALNDANNTITINHKFTKGYIRLFDIYLETKQYENALIACNALLELEPNNGRAKFNLAKIIDLIGKHDIRINNDGIVLMVKGLLSGVLLNETQDICLQLAKLLKASKKDESTQFIYPISLLTLPTVVENDINSSRPSNEDRKSRNRRNDFDILIKENIEKDQDRRYKSETFNDFGNKFASQKDEIAGSDVSKKAKLQAVQRMLKFKEENNKKEEGVVQTSILNKYKRLYPDLKKINHNNDNVQIYKVVLNDNRQFILKTVSIEKEKLGGIYSLLLEFYIGRTFSLLCDKVAKTLDMKEIEFGENNSMIRIELLTEYGGESARVLLEEKEIKKPVEMGYQLLQILVEMEESGIAHFDIKPHNIVWNEITSQLKLIDFGTSMTFYLNPETIKHPLEENTHLICGFTRMYAPPELIKSKDNDIAKTIIPHKVDIFCFGLTFAELLFYKHKTQLTDSYPLDQKEYNEYLDDLKNVLYKLKEGIWAELIVECLSYYQSKRPNAKELIEKFEKVLIKEKMEYIIPPKESKDYTKCIRNALKHQEWELAMLYCKKLEENLLSTQSSSFETKTKLMLVNREMSQSFNELGIYSKGIKNREKAIKLNEETFGTKNLDLIIDYYYIGNALTYIGNPMAVEWLKKSISSIIQVYGESSDKTLYIYQIIALSYAKSHDKEKALEYCTKIECSLHNENIEDNSIWESYYAFTGIYWLLNNKSKAYEYAKKAILISQEMKEKDITRLRDSLNYFGTLYFLNHDYKNAIEYNLQALSIGLKINDGINKEVAEIEAMLGSCYFKVLEYQKAIDYKLKSEIIYKKLYGENNIYVAENNKIVANIYQWICNYPWCIEYYQRALRIYKYLLGENNLDVVYIIFCLGQVYLLGRNHDLAIDYMKKAEGKLKTINNVASDVFFDVYANFSRIYSEVKEYDLANEYNQKCLKIGRDERNNNPMRYLKALQIICKFYNMKTQPELCIEAFKEIEKIIQEHPDKKEEIYADCYCAYGEALNMKHNYQLAIKYYNIAIDIYLNVYTDKSPYFIWEYHQLGDCYIKIKDYKNADICYLKIINMLNKLSIENQLLGIAYLNLSVSYLNQGNNKDAIKYSEKAIEMFTYYSPEEYEKNKFLAYQAIGTGYLNEKNYQLSLQNFEKAVLEYTSYNKDENCEFIAVCYNNIASLYKIMKNYKIASVYYEKLGKIVSILPKSFRVAVSCYEVAIHNMSINRMDHAIPLLQKSLSFFEENLGNDVSWLKRIYRNLIKCYELLKDTKKALYLYKKVYPFYLKNYGHKTKTIIRFFTFWSYTAETIGEYNSAIEALYLLISFLRKQNGKEDAVLGETCYSMGRCKKKVGKVKDSLFYYHCSIHMLQNYVGEDEVIIIASMNLADIYLRINEIQIAIKYFNKGLNIAISNKKLTQQYDWIIKKKILELTKMMKNKPV